MLRVGAEDLDRAGNVSVWYDSSPVGKVVFVCADVPFLF